MRFHMKRRSVNHEMRLAYNGKKKECWKTMSCNNRMVYIVQDGDSLYQLARQFDTTVTDLILGNPGINPYNLQVGMRMNICPGMSQMPQQPSMPGMNTRPTPEQPGMSPMPQQPSMPPMLQQPSMPGMNTRPTPEQPGMSPMPGRPGRPGRPGSEDEDVNESPNEIENEVEALRDDMREAWIDLIFWYRMYLMSVNSGSKNQREIEERLVEAVDEITDIFAEYLTVSQTRQLRNLLAQHVELGVDLIRMRKENNMQNYDEVVKAWYANANEIADLLAQTNPYFAGREVRNMLLNYLDLTRKSVEQELQGAYGDSIESFRDLQKEVLQLADYFARGLLAR